MGALVRCVFCCFAFVDGLVALVGVGRVVAAFRPETLSWLVALLL